MDTADIRIGIYNQLTGSVSAVNNRVFWAYTAPADTPKPFIYLTISTSSSLLNPLGMFYVLRVYVLGQEGTAHVIDDVADDVVGALHKVDISTPEGSTICPVFDRDSRFEDWNENVRAHIVGLSFTVPVSIRT